MNLCKKIIGNIGIFLERTDCFSSDDIETTVYCLYITNYSKKRITGKIMLETFPPTDVCPEDNIMISVKPEGTVSTEFKAARPIASQKPAFLVTFQPDEGSKITARFETDEC